jgi:TonB-dependent receptor
MKPVTSQFFAATLLVLLLSFAAPAARAAELYLSVFIGSNPLEGLEVELDDRFIGLTGSRGDALADLGSGRHTVKLLKDGVALATYAFDVADGENAEISFSFSDFLRKPEVAIDKYRAGDSSGATGVLGGVVSDSEGQPVAGARLAIEPAGVEVVSADDGSYELEVPRGSYDITVSHPDFRQANATVRVIANVGIIANVIMRRDVAMSADTADIDEIVVIGSFKPTRDAVGLKRLSIAVTDSISIDDLLRFGDSDVAASLRRIVGVSVTGGRYAVVRGLDGRYIASTLNGSLMPSTDPFRRDVQLDLFPNDILGGIEIQKTFTADMPGDTTGGIVRIRTRDLPDEYVNSLSASLGLTTGVTGEDLLSYRGSGSDDYGFDDGLRTLPGDISAATNGGLSFRVCSIEGQSNCVDAARAAELAGQLPNIYNPRTESAAPNFGLGYALGNTFDRDIGTVGVYGSVAFESESKSRQDAFIDVPNERSSRYARDEFETDLSAYFVTGVENGDWKALAKTMLLRSSEDTVQVEEGVDFAQNQVLRNVLLEWVERQFLAQQFEGSVFLPRSHQIDWRAGVSQTRRDAPDRRAYQYRGAENAEGGFDAPLLVVPTIERSYADLTEDGIDLGADYLLPVTFSDSVATDVKLGVLFNRRDRQSDLVRIGFSGGNNIDRTLDLESLLTQQNFNSREFTLRAASLPTDNYEAEQDTLAYYVNTTTNIGEAVTVVAGVRKDDFTQTIDFPNSDAPSVEIESRELLPALGLIYRLTDAWQFRAGYSATVSRPNITENAPTRFFDDRGREYIGCTAAQAPACKASMIDNYDLRAEYYFNGNRDSVSLALFFKEISDPIERAISDASGSSVNALTFRNNESADVSGIEFDASWTAVESDAHLLKLGGNVALITSKIKLGELGRQLEADPDRDLQGQSPLLANLQIGYDHLPTMQKITLVANYFDDRIDIVARAPQTPIYEVGRAVMNLSYEKAFTSRSKLSLRIKNLLDEKVEYEQNGVIIEGYKEGAEFSIGYTQNF